MERNNQQILETLCTVFPICSIAIDSIHVRIQAPENIGALRFSIIKSSSIILLTLVVTNYNLLMYNIEAYKKNSEDGIFFH